MSAITGIFYRDGRSVDPELIKKMNKRLSHRGPDGSAVWCEGPIALGHQMLWTTPESLHEKLPFQDEDSGLVITADARIDNRDELSNELGIEDNEKVSDSYFILKAYSKWGEKCPEHLLGDFAFAIWDKNNEKLFCARDHMGVKPFYYYLDDDKFFFATEIKAILNIPNFPCKLNEKRLASFLMGTDFSEKENTFYKNIKSLIAAHSIVVEKNIIEIKRYWKLNPKSQIIMDSDEDYAKAFREIFEKAVKCRLRSNNPIGVLLSGGLDSSSVICMARKIRSENGNNCLDDINTFSYVFDDFPEADERYYINNIVNNRGIKPHFIKCDEISPLKDINTLLSYQDQPLSSIQIALVHNSRKIIHNNGIRVLLTGEGGDEVVSIARGYRIELLMTFQWKKLIRIINDLSNLHNINRLYLFIVPIFQVIQYYLIKWPRLYYCLKKNDDNILNNDFLRRVRINRQMGIKDKLHTIILPKKFHYFMIDALSSQMNFERIDSENSIFSIESRHPFYDKRVIEFCYAIPTEMKMKFGFGKYILRIAMDEILPKEIQWRATKSQIGGASIRNFLSEKKILERITYDDKLIGDYVNVDKLQNAFKTEYGTTMRMVLWSVVLVYFWLKNNKYIIKK